jgi:hypothetical protein
VLAASNCASPVAATSWNTVLNARFWMPVDAYRSAGLIVVSTRSMTPTVRASR